MRLQRYTFTGCPMWPDENGPWCLSGDVAKLEEEWAARVQQLHALREALLALNDRCGFTIRLHESAHDSEGVTREVVLVSDVLALLDTLGL